MAERLTWRLGEEALLQIVLQDATNRPARAHKDLVINVEVKPSSGPSRQAQTSIAAGMVSGELRLRFDTPGVISISARHPELREGGIILSVKPVSGSAPPLTTAAGPPDLPPEGPSPASPPNPQPPGTLILSYTPNHVLANGKDFATVTAIYDPRGPTVADSDVKVFLESNDATLDPKVLVIPKGEAVGQSTLTSRRPGKAHVKFLWSRPVAQPVDGRADLEIDFDPEIVGIQAKASPPKITLVDVAEIVVTLQGPNNAVVTTDIPRAVSLTMQSGRGEIDQSDLQIGAGSFLARSKFLPSWVGSAEIAVSTPNLPSPSTVSVQVGWPGMLLVLSTLGGLIGGVLAFWSVQGAKWWRIVAGLVTGPVLYWALLFGILNLISRGIVLNPISAIFLSVIGGFLGTHVFSLILRKLGVTLEGGDS